MMQPDKTEIVIRERTLSELFDLSLVLIRSHLRPLLVSSAMLGLPFMVLNIGLAFALIQPSVSDGINTDVDISDEMNIRRMLHICALWFLVLPIALAPATIYIGNQIFFETLSAKEIWKRFRATSRQCLWFLGFWRLGLFGYAADVFLLFDNDFNPLVEIMLLVMGLVGLASLFRATHPFAVEVLVLEACPRKASRPGEVTYKRRMQGLHAPFFAENFGRFIVASMVFVFLFVSLISVQYTGFQLLDWMSLDNRWVNLVLVPVTLWMVSIFAVVFRFLSYLDSRIKLEGWEVDLQMKAERARLLPLLLKSGTMEEDDTLSITGGNPKPQATAGSSPPATAMPKVVPNSPITAEVIPTDHASPAVRESVP